jgi:hypothetical protein
MGWFEAVFWTASVIRYSPDWGSFSTFMTYSSMVGVMMYLEMLIRSGWGFLGRRLFHNLLQISMTITFADVKYAVLVQLLAIWQCSSSAPEALVLEGIYEVFEVRSPVGAPHEVVATANDEGSFLGRWSAATCSGTAVP